MYDINKPYVKEDITKWISDKQSMVEKGLALNVSIKLAKINDYDIKTHKFKYSDWKPIYESAN